MVVVLKTSAACDTVQASTRSMDEGILNGSEVMFDSFALVDMVI